MSLFLDRYIDIAGPDAIAGLRQLGSHFSGQRIVHVNSTREGGGVAEILNWLIPASKDLGLDPVWEVIEGDEAFFDMTKALHNGMQGQNVTLTPGMIAAYEEANRRAAEKLGPLLREAEYVYVHDPQPAMLRNLIGPIKGHWVWRCHIDCANRTRPAWKFLRPLVEGYDASVFSMPQFAPTLKHPQFIIAPSIDPISDKNRPLARSEIDGIRSEYNLDPDRPLMVQISRFDRFKDPVGVIKAYRLVRRYFPIQLVLAGGGATDDPEGVEVLKAVKEEAAGDSDIHVLFLPGDAHLVINALQCAADIIVQKSTREGFGLTVTEGMWKGKPVIGGNVGGIRLQVFDYQTGFLANTPEGAAQRILYLLRHPPRIQKLGDQGREFVRENFLLTRQLREHITLLLGLSMGLSDRIFAQAPKVNDETTPVPNPA
jgi:trehalose synthase